MLDLEKEIKAAKEYWDQFQKDGDSKASSYFRGRFNAFTDCRIMTQLEKDGIPAFYVDNLGHKCTHKTGADYKPVWCDINTAKVLLGMTVETDDAHGLKS